MDANTGRARGELCAVFLTACLYLLFENVFQAKLIFMIPAVAAWGSYVVWRLVRTPGQAQAWGLAGSGFGPAARAAGAFFLVALSALVTWRLLLGWRPLPEGAFLLFALYPVWALVQQFLLQSLVVDNLRRLRWGPRSVIPVAAALFGLVHVPDLPLMALCAVAGIVWTAIFLRTRNLWPLAVVHAWTGTLVYYWVLERDPWAEALAQRLSSGAP
ncbi:MAG TPA: CPBP family intramembrane glutamic endopeptidase [Planctomycetota bacterium]|nr:CPBP family intramembrane glutamic endopeptidase [Planctomycetota bacterium]